MIIGRDIDRTLEITDEPVLDADPDRFETMIQAYPEGEFYLHGGAIIPKRKDAYALRFTALDAPSRTFNVVISGVLKRTIVTDNTGVVEFSDVLVAGEGSGNVTIRIEDTVEVGRALIAYVTPTNFGLLDAAIAAVMEDVDDDIADVRADTFLDTVDAADIEQKFGIRIGTQRAANWSLDLYREILNELYQAYDIFSGTERGLEQVVGAITQVPPTSYRQADIGPRWVLGFQYLRNNEFAFDSDSDGSPDDWFIETAGTTMVIDTAGVGLTNLFAAQRLEVTAAGVSPEAVFSEALSLFSEFLGFEFTFSAWVESTGAFSIIVGISDDGGSTWTESAPIVTTTSPQFLSVTKIIDVAAPSLRVRVRQSGSAVGNVWYIERTSLFIRGITGLYLGDATIPRSIRRGTLGQTMVWWTPRDLTLEEYQISGLTDFIEFVVNGTKFVGHVEEIVPVHVVVQDRNISLFSPTVLTIPGVKITHIRDGASLGTGALKADTTGSPPTLEWREPGEAGFGTPVSIPQSGVYVLENVAGQDSIVVAVDHADLITLTPPGATDAVDIISAIQGYFTTTDWNAGLTRINLDIITRTPDVYSYLKPSLPSAFTETLEFDLLTKDAPLSFDSTEDQLQTVLLEDGISLPADKWSFVDPTTINVPALNASAVYEFTYEVLMEFETDSIDLGVDWQSLNWIFDSYAYERFEKNRGEVAQTQELLFNRDTLQANLRFRTNEDQETSRLLQILNGIETTVSTLSWSYFDALTVQISGTIFNANATYVLEYTAEKLVTNQVPRLEFEIASSTDDIAFTAFTSILRGDYVDNTKRYHKLKVQAFDVLDIRDLKIRSLVLKGFRFINDGPGL